MKILTLVIFFNVILISQEIKFEYRGYDYSKNDKRLVSFEQESNGIIRIKNKLTGSVTFKLENISTLPADFEPDLTIDLRTIDTSQYSSIFSLWSEVPVSFTSPLVVADANLDERVELYGAYQAYGMYNTEYVIYEINYDGTYDSVYHNPDSLGLVRAITDLENDGSLESINYMFSEDSGQCLKIFTIDSGTGYPIRYKSFFRPPGGGQAVDINFFDMDNDTFPEMIYFLIGDTILNFSHNVAEYNRESNQIEPIYQNRPPTYYTSGYSFGDFDSDGKQNFAVGSIWGEIYVYEHVEENNYNMLQIDSLPLSHTFISAFTNDLNLNGIPELWIAGEGYINGVGSTILYLYESGGDDKYKTVYSIAIIGITSIFAFNMLTVDVDNDGIEEVLICIDQHVLIFKYNNQEYELFYIKRNDLLNQNSVYYSATTADFDGDGYPDILISMDQVENSMIRIFTRIYKKSSTLDIRDFASNNAYFLSEPYPNPFNPTTTIQYSIKNEASISLKVFDILGREIKTLFRGIKRRGEYKIIWDGTDEDNNKVSAGIYLINIVSGQFNKSIKTVLLK